MSKKITYAHLQELREIIGEIWEGCTKEKCPENVFKAFEQLDAELLEWQNTL